MGSNESRPPREKPQFSAYQELQRQREQLEAEKCRWEEKTREQHWREQQAREQQKLKEAALEWTRQEELRKLQLQQQKLKKELEEQKLQRQAEQKKIQKQLEEQRQQARLKEQRQQQERLEEQRILMQQVQLRQERFVQQLCPIVLSTSSPSTLFGARETVAVQQRASIDINKTSFPKPPEKTTKSYVTRMSESNVKYSEWSIIDYVKDANSINKKTAENVMKLFDEGNTVPFIARYRNHVTQRMDAKKLRKLRYSYEHAKLIKQCAVAIVKILEEKSKWTPEIHAYVHETKSLLDLEHVKSVFNKVSSKTGKKAEILGLGLLAQFCMENKAIPSLSSLVDSSVEGLRTAKEIEDGVVCLIADIIIRDRRTFETIKKLRSKYTMEIETTKSKAVDKLKDHTYEAYYHFKSMEWNIQARQVFAINKGESLKALIVKINVPSDFERDFKQQSLLLIGVRKNTVLLNQELINAAIDSAYTRSVIGAVAKRTRQEITERAQNWAIDDLTRNIKVHLVAPPLRGKVVLGIRPSFDKGCKLAAVSEQGNVLETDEIYPHDPNKPMNKKIGENIIVRMISKHKCEVVALGNGKAWKETEIFLIHVFKNKKIASLDVTYTIVDESSATIYSNSPEAALEFPGVEAGVISAISIARRLQDPMSELAKIEPELLVVDMYHDVISAEKMSAKIKEVIVEMISYVGVDVNTASLALLKNVAGLDDAKANSIIEHRSSSGPFVKRNDLLKVRGMSNRVFEQCAGFMRIVAETAISNSRQRISEGSFNFFDETWIHPESYNLAKSLIEAARYDVAKMGTGGLIFGLNEILAKKFGTNAETVEMIIQGLLMEKGMDIRGKIDASIFRKSLIKFADLNNGDVLSGEVTNLAAFGAFIDVGAEINGLLHKRCMKGISVAVGQKVDVRVSNISKERGRLGLELISRI